MERNLILSGENVGAETGTQLAEIKKAVLSPLVNVVSDWDLYNELAKRVSEAYVDSRETLPNEQDLEYLVNKLIFNLRRDKKNIRIDEIEIAFNNGINERYGKYYGLGVKAFFMFICSYVDQPERLTALQDVKLIATAAPEPSIKDKFKVFKNNALELFKMILEKRDFSKLAPAVYDFLFNVRFFRITKEEIDVLAEKAGEIYAKRLEVEKATTFDVYKNREISAKIDAYIAGNKNTVALWNIAKTEYIRALFADLIVTQGVTIPEMFEAMIDEHFDDFVEYLQRLEVERKQRLINQVNKAAK